MHKGRNGGFVPFEARPEQSYGTAAKLTLLRRREPEQRLSSSYVVWCSDCVMRCTPYSVGRADRIAASGEAVRGDAVQHGFGRATTLSLSCSFHFFLVTSRSLLESQLTIQPGRRSEEPGLWDGCACRSQAGKQASRRNSGGDVGPTQGRRSQRCQLAD